MRHAFDGATQARAQSRPEMTADEKAAHGFAFQLSAEQRVEQGLYDEESRLVVRKDSSTLANHATPKVAQNWINGAWNDTGETLESISPSTGLALGRFVSAGPEAASAAIAAARVAFDTTTWARDLRQRANTIEQLANRLEQRIQEIAVMLSREGGKLLPQTQWEVGGAVVWLRYSAATARLQNVGRAMETSPGVFFLSYPEPVGVVSVNYAMEFTHYLTIRAIGPALAAGCTVVVTLPSLDFHVALLP